MVPTATWGKKYADVYRNFFKLVEAECLEDNLEELVEQVDVVFTATPQGLCSALVSENVLKKIKVIDLILIAAENNTVRFVPPLMIKRSDVDEMLYKLESLLSEE